VRSPQNKRKDGVVSGTMPRKTIVRRLTCVVFLIGTVACTEEPSRQPVPDLESMSPTLTKGTAEGFILKAGEGEPLLNGLVVKASPKTGTTGSILVEQTFQRGFVCVFVSLSECVSLSVSVSGS